MFCDIWYFVLAYSALLAFARFSTFDLHYELDCFQTTRPGSSEEESRYGFAALSFKV